MYIILEYAICVGLVFVAGALLFGACAAFLLIQEVVGTFEIAISALIHDCAPIVRPARHLSIRVR